MNQKKYITYLMTAIILFVAYHLIMWTFFTSKIFGLDDKTSVGDLARMSYQVDMLVTKKLQYTLPKSFIYDKTFKDQKIDLITIGDSFSHAACGGLNPYYQDYLASIYNKNILNVNPIKYDQFIETVVGLINSGYFKKHKTKYILIQSVERFLMPRFNKQIYYKDFYLKSPQISKKITSVKHLKVELINTANYKIPYYYLAYKFQENAQKNVYRFPLTTKLFSKKKSLLIFKDDIKNIPQFTPQAVISINNSFNKLAKLLKKQQIKLIFMPTTDKYDLYYDFLVNNKHPKNPFFDLIRPLHKDYIFIDTKRILTLYLKKRKKDIYYIDDTHWSNKASEAIAKSQQFQGILGK